MYVYTTLRLEDGGGLFGYYAPRPLGRPIEDYCFCVYLDAAGTGHLLSDGALERLDLDEDDIASRWRVTWRGAATVRSTRTSLFGPTRSSGRGAARTRPQTRRAFGFPPLVLDATVRVQDGEQRVATCAAGVSASTSRPTSLPATSRGASCRMPHPTRAQGNRGSNSVLIPSRRSNRSNA